MNLHHRESSPAIRRSAHDLARADWEGMTESSTARNGRDAALATMPTLSQIARIMSERDCPVACIANRRGRLVGMVTDLPIVCQPLERSLFVARQEESLRHVLDMMVEFGLYRLAVEREGYPRIALLAGPALLSPGPQTEAYVRDAFTEISGHKTIWVQA